MRCVSAGLASRQRISDHGVALRGLHEMMSRRDDHHELPATRFVDHRRRLTPPRAAGSSTASFRWTSRWHGAGRRSTVERAFDDSGCACRAGRGIGDPVEGHPAARCGVGVRFVLHRRVGGKAAAPRPRGGVEREQPMARRTQIQRVIDFQRRGLGPPNLPRGCLRCERSRCAAGVERVVKKLRRANEILKLASVLSAPAELDHRLK